MNIELRKLSQDDGVEIYDMLQEIPKYENGLVNGCNGKPFDEYRKWLAKSDNIANGIGLENWMVPQSTFWIYVDGIPVGFGKLRHYLTDKLKEEGGHIGYAIRPTYRNRGFGKILLRLILEKAKQMEINKVLITVHNNNVSSIKVALANGGVVEKITYERHLIWIDCNNAV